MNRCITCGKIVTRPKAQNSVTFDEHSYLVCCPMCEKEFNNDPAHYVAVAQSVFGDYALKAHSQAEPIQYEHGTSTHADEPVQYVRMLWNLQASFHDIQKQYKELSKHLDNISEAGGLNGLRNTLQEHRALMDSLQEKMTIHAGVCRFVVSVAETSVKTHS